ncbi:general stress protein [Piscibacillus halophilus]|uniref:Heat induced stress protein YflT n=2 Tax=Piscibacillus halophilus TaxID=571933 RepID=A0A1H9IUE3_9BACI|nr:general stress protein [Piscibacillus halophilus]SEQ78213.1 Heat induced stress protein YflT [Piscibacillus halophilus]
MPFVREYTNDEQLVKDVQKLKENGIDQTDVYVLSHDDDRTERIASNARANTIGFSEQDVKNFLSNMFNQKGDELRTKLQEMGFSEEEANKYEEDLDEGKVLLIVNSNQAVSTII